MDENVGYYGWYVSPNLSLYVFREAGLMGLSGIREGLHGFGELLFVRCSSSHVRIQASSGSRSSHSLVRSLMSLCGTCREEERRKGVNRRC